MKELQNFMTKRENNILNGGVKYRPVFSNIYKYILSYKQIYFLRKSRYEGRIYHVQ